MSGDVLVSMKTVRRSELAALLGGAQGPEQQRARDLARERARAVQARLDAAAGESGGAQGALGLTVPDALEELLAGRVAQDVPGAGAAYRRAQIALLAGIGSEPVLLGSYAAPPKALYARMDEEMRALGVPEPLLPYRFLFAGAPEELPLPEPPDGHPGLGSLPVDRAGAVAEAGRQVAYSLGTTYYAARPLVDALEAAHQEWQRALRSGRRDHADLIVFWSDDE
ncbi:hypothetical protein SLNWT_2846 [Streptomyces albus]|uniref:DUF7691 domain-containing protein n=1 Tax=Streptomyces albus (strain ATCC 21838 / DSM 41398 / FERM P-419 / JCM 4703 / NBRC 107858) TaxID=1081613 RepID=A0A0B5EYQ4_STRA4|nr:hypothetical protein SLNWT_2846 [Streptomyces albus]AOU77535.1 hypothetical protein SLNHY_2844 [Streptomyces albus]AYN33306.1 hypothetical protein DUI70_2805 [Streptomyces albus]